MECTLHFFLFCIVSSKFFKLFTDPVQVRPIFDVLNKASSKWFKMDGKYSVDEMMVPYFGRHSSKQFIRGKPIRYGFKVRIILTYVHKLH